jgi:hypothetical protein
LKELETQILVSQRLGFTEAVDADPLMVRCTEIGQMLTILRRRLVAR